MNFAPIPATQGSFLVRGLTNDVTTTFRVVTVDSAGAESKGVTATGTPSSKNTAKVTFTVDARTQGNGPIELRRFDTGSQIEYPMTQDTPGVWKTSIDLPLFREVKFKFGNDSAGAKNGGYEAPGQGDRAHVVGTNGNAYSGTYDFTEQPVPAATVTGRVTGGGQNLGGALVEATSANPALNYAITFPDGTYTLRVPAGAQTLKASAGGYLDGTLTVTAPAQDANIDLARDLRTKYNIDGDLSDWTAPPSACRAPPRGLSARTTTG